MSSLRTVTATRYVTPLREGGSLPAIMEADDLGTYVVKFVGAGQGRKVLVAEVIAGELGRALGLPVPPLAIVEVDPLLGLAEPDAEVQDLLRASAGANLAMDFLPGALGDEARLRAMDPAADVAAVAELLAGLSGTCDGRGPARAVTLGQRFRWLTAPRSTVLQTGPVHGGLTDDPHAELERLFDAIGGAPAAPARTGPR